VRALEAGCAVIAAGAGKVEEIAVSKMQSPGRAVRVPKSPRLKARAKVSLQLQRMPATVVPPITCTKTGLL
jgi:hypothetical protein